MSTFRAFRASNAVTPSSATIASAASQTADCDLAARGFYAADLQVLVTIAAGSPNGDVTLEYFSSPTQSAGNLDTLPFTTRRINFTGTGTKSLTLHGVSAGFVRIRGTNGTGVSVTWAIMMEGLTQVSDTSDVFDVLLYGAVGGPGTTDDTAAIQAAIDAADAAGGGVVYFPPGVYNCASSLVLPRQTADVLPVAKVVSFRGAGREVSILTTAAASILLTWETVGPPNDETNDQAAVFMIDDMTIRTTKLDGQILKWRTNDPNITRDRFYFNVHRVNFDYQGRSTRDGAVTRATCTAVQISGADYSIETLGNDGWGTTAVGDLLVFDTTYATGKQALCRVTGLSYGGDADKIRVTVLGRSDTIAAASKPVSVRCVLFAMEIYGGFHCTLDDVNILGGSGATVNPWSYGLLLEQSSHCTLRDVYGASGRNAGLWWIRDGGNHMVISTRNDSGTRYRLPQYVIEDAQGIEIHSLTSEGADEAGWLIKDSFDVQLFNMRVAACDGFANADAVHVQNSKGIRWYGGRIPDQDALGGSGYGLYFDDDCDFIRVHDAMAVDVLSNVRMPASYVDTYATFWDAADNYTAPTERYEFGKQAAICPASTESVVFKDAALNQRMMWGIGNGSLIVNPMYDGTIAFQAKRVATATAPFVKLLDSDGSTSLCEIETTGDLKAAGGYRQTIDGWYQDNAAATQTAVQLTRFAAGVVPTMFVPVRAGSVLGVCVLSNEARTAGTLTVEVYKNGAATGLTAVLNGTDTTFKATTQGKDNDTFVAGDQIDLRVTTSADWTPVTADIRATLEIES